MAKLNMLHGLFEVVDGIYQARGYDLSVMSIIRSDSGYIVVDPFVSAECAGTIWRELVIPKLGNKPIVAVIYTHSHVDHYGGMRGIVSQADIDAGKVKVLAPVHFTEAAVGENIIAGNAMSRRASYMYGSLLPTSVVGQVDSGLRKTTSNGTVTLALPTDHATTTEENITIDGIELKVLMAPESEAPAEFMFYLPKYKAFCAVEDVTHTLHNLYTLAELGRVMEHKKIDPLLAATRSLVDRKWPARMSALLTRSLRKKRQASFVLAQSWQTIGLLCLKSPPSCASNLPSLVLRRSSGRLQSAISDSNHAPPSRVHCTASDSEVSKGSQAVRAGQANS